MEKHDCDKCNGTGKVNWKHIEGGRCFKCGGVGKLDYKPFAPHVEIDRDVDGDSWNRQEEGERGFLDWATGNELHVSNDL